MKMNCPRCGKLVDSLELEKERNCKQCKFDDPYEEDDGDQTSIRDKKF